MSPLRYYVVSDVHGFYTPLRTALSDAGYFDDPQPHKLLMLGDLFDRGSEALELQAFVCELLAREEVILIRGNHEELYRELATVDAGFPYDHHLHNGTYQTALDLTGMDRTLALRHGFSLAHAALTTPFYRELMPAMLDYYETPHYIFVHGWIPCVREPQHRYTPIDDWRSATAEQWKQARWFNGMDAYRTVRDEKTIVCGHWHASYGHSKREGNGPEFGPGADFTPFQDDGILAIDACTAASGLVNCVVIED